MRAACLVALASVVPIVAQAATWVCVSTAKSAAQSSDFCKGVPVPSPGACTSNGDEYVSNHRSNDSFVEQQNQCSGPLKKHKVCPNDPTRCLDDVFNQTTWCGQYDQACAQIGAKKSSCLAYCWADCYPCNDAETCEMMVDFGISAEEGAPCFSLEGRNIPPAVIARAREAAASRAGL